MSTDPQWQPERATTERASVLVAAMELARVTGADYLVPAWAHVSFARTPVADGDTLSVDGGLALRALATPGHTPHHTSYVLTEDERGVAAFTGGSLLIGTVGRPDLAEPRLTEHLARAQHASAHRLAAELDDVAGDSRGSVWERHCTPEDLPPARPERQLWPEGGTSEGPLPARSALLRRPLRPRGRRWSVITHE